MADEVPEWQQQLLQRRAMRVASGQGQGSKTSIEESPEKKAPVTVRVVAGSLKDRIAKLGNANAFFEISLVLEVSLCQFSLITSRHFS
jgi:hypothetical protein